MQLAFWLLTATVIYVFAGYPLLLKLLQALGLRARLTYDASEPTVTLLISAFNEEDVIAEKLRNSLELDYPRERLRIVVISDASADRTDEIVRGFESRGVELLRMPDRGGKTVGLNEAVRRSPSDVIVFSDANAMYARDAIRKLVRNFADPRVGAAVGQSTYTASEVESERQEGLYWRYETAIKRLESSVGSVVGGDGAVYAVRRSLYKPMRADALSDFVNPLMVVKSGHRCVYEHEAISYEKAGESFDKEFRRKVRIVNRAWRAMLSMSELLNPLRYGFFAVELISHKLLRWLVPVFLAALLIVSALLATTASLYALAFGLQLAFYALAVLGYALRHRPSVPAFASIPYYFCLVNIASARGILDACLGKTYTTWTTARAAGNS
jgi:cellulose synthase/poly-beta-1,6-N-acetylglucosamine synthase-like glycosyltransferase